MKAKDWAVSQGYCNPGRGRMPKAAHEAIQKAIAGGMTFSDYKGAPAPKGQRVTVSKDSSEDAPVVITKRDDSQNYSPAFYRFGEGTEFEYEHEGRMYTVTGRTACMGCGYSLVGHTCESMVGLTKHGQKVITVKGR